MFNGGFYIFKDGIYTENLTFFSNQSMIGTVARFKIRFEGDRFYMDSCDENGKVIKTGAFEVWERATVK